MDAPFLDGRPKRLLIGGEWVAASSGRTFDSINPSTGKVIGEIADAEVADVDAAVAAARRAFEGPWSRFTPQDRQNILLKLADIIEQNIDDLRLLDVLDMGAPIRRTRRSNRVVETLRYFAGWATKLHGETVPNSLPGSVFSYTLKEPVGVCASIIAWNGPLGATLSKIAPVLATGCTTVVKPAPEASLTALRVGELIQELGLPPGVVNIVTGGGNVGAALAEHPDVDKVAFTGSSATGQKIVRAAAGNLKRVSLELGGKSPHVIFADANLEAALPVASNAVFGNSGQVCYAGTRVFVERPVYEEFVSRMSDIANSLVVGNSVDEATDIGPVVSQAQLDRVTGYLEIGRKEGVRTAAGGSRAIEGDLAHGYFVAPTVFADVRDEMRVAQEEIFGPVASVLPFDSFDEVSRRANLTAFGLGGGVWTRDIGRAHALAASIKTGMVWINSYGLGDPAMPHGGTKMSGWGSEYSIHGLDEYLDVKAVWIRTDV
ncbi:aldehyde dehydrogenase family protein [Nocardioides sp.]|uniref:aldehyde dehydrogenase family protein n=1 Tax=Nocardioides sp. TaxID=35761 RepID=UPI003D09B512